VTVAANATLPVAAAGVRAAVTVTGKPTVGEEENDNAIELASLTRTDPLPLEPA
jgi:hypothetical protein